METQTDENIPKCEKREYDEEWFGKKLDDPYHWLRDEKDPDVLAWVAKENEYTDQWFDKKELEEKIKALKKEKLEPVWQDIHSWGSGYVAVKTEEGVAEIYRLNADFQIKERLFPEKLMQ